MSKRLSVRLAAVAVALTAVVGTPATMAQQAHERSPWSWSLDERLAARFASAQRQEKAQTPRAGGRRVYEIDGSDTPELFLEHELFIHLIERGFPEYNGGRAGGERRLELLAQAAPLGFGSDFWTRLERVAAPFLRLRRQDMELGRNEAKEQTPEERSARDPLGLCRAQNEALTAAKEEFGEEKLLRLLYSVIAPPISQTHLPDDPDGEAATLRFVAEGCR